MLVGKQPTHRSNATAVSFYFKNYWEIIGNLHFTFFIKKYNVMEKNFPHPLFYLFFR